MQVNLSFRIRKNISITATLTPTDWVLSLRLRRRRIFLGLPCSLYQLFDLFIRRHLRLVLQGARMEGSQRMLLV